MWDGRYLGIAGLLVWQDCGCDFLSFPKLLCNQKCSYVYFCLSICKDKYAFVAVGNNSNFIPIILDVTLDFKKMKSKI